MLHVVLFTQDTEFINLINALTQQVSFSIKTCRTRKEAILYIRKNPVCLCIIDRDHEDENFCAALKLTDEKIPVVVFSGDQSEYTMLRSFEMGCDDYILKTASLAEIRFRIQSVIKRTTYLWNSQSQLQNMQQEPISIGNAVIDFKKRLFYTQKEQIILSKKEASLLQLFYKNKGKLLKREEILKEVWDSPDCYASKSMDVYLGKLRKILSEEESVSIQNIRGTGYMLVDNRSIEQN
jgi:DNA-binding response OmpR family regulator